MQEVKQPSKRPLVFYYIIALAIVMVLNITFFPAVLERQVQSSVYLEDTIRRLAQLGVDTVVEIGPGKALTGFVRKTAKQIKCYPVETAEDLQAALTALKGE